METEHRLTKLEEKMGDMDKNLGIFQEIIKRFDNSINKLTNSLDKFDGAVDDLKVNMMKLGNEVECHNKDIDQLKTKVETIDSKGKFDWMQFMAGKVIPFLVGGGAIWGILKIIEGA